MRINVYPFTATAEGAPILSAFIDSLYQHQVVVHKTLQLDQCDLAVIWGMVWSNLNRKLIYQHYRERGIPVVVLETGALDRGTLWRVGINGANGLAEFGLGFDEKRSQALALEATPWRKRGKHILVCGQNQQSGEWHMGTMEYYLELIVAKLRRHTNRPIIVRPHPKATGAPTHLGNFSDVVVETPQRGAPSELNLLDTLDNAWAVVSHNDNPGVQAVIQGIPVFCDPSSLAAPVGNFDLSQIESPWMPDRSQWLSQIAHTEWTQTEIEIGVVWDRLQRALR